MTSLAMPPRTPLTAEKRALIAELEALADADLAEMLATLRAEHGPHKENEPARIVDLLELKADVDVMLRRLDCLMYEITRRVDLIERQSAGDVIAKEAAV